MELFSLENVRKLAESKQGSERIKKCEQYRKDAESAIFYAASEGKYCCNFRILNSDKILNEMVAAKLEKQGFHTMVRIINHEFILVINWS